MTIAAVYFAYGCNLDPTQMQERCPGHRQIGRLIGGAAHHGLPKDYIAALFVTATEPAA